MAVEIYLWYLFFSHQDDWLEKQKEDVVIFYIFVFPTVNGTIHCTKIIPKVVLGAKTRIRTKTHYKKSTKKGAKKNTRKSTKNFP